METTSSCEEGASSQLAECSDIALSFTECLCRHGVLSPPPRWWARCAEVGRVVVLAAERPEQRRVVLGAICPHTSYPSAKIQMCDIVCTVRSSRYLRDQKQRQIACELSLVESQATTDDFAESQATSDRLCPQGTAADCLCAYGAQRLSY